MIKQILVFARKSMKLTILIAVSIFLIICAVALFFKPIYSVTINGEQVGYSKDKSKLQARINKYIESVKENRLFPIIHADNSSVNLAFNHNLNMVRVGFNLYNLNFSKENIKTIKKAVVFESEKSLCFRITPFVVRKKLWLYITPLGKEKELSL